MMKEYDLSALEKLDEQPLATDPDERIKQIKVKQAEMEFERRAGELIEKRFLIEFMEGWGAITSDILKGAAAALFQQIDAVYKRNPNGDNAREAMDIYQAFMNKIVDDMKELDVDAVVKRQTNETKQDRFNERVSNEKKKRV